jgi:hypothetical protein
MNGGAEEREEKPPKPRIGITNFERRRHPRFTVDLPLEYCRVDSSEAHAGRAVNASEGGLLIYFPEQMEIGQHLKVRLFFSSGSHLNRMECLVEVVWIDLNMGQGWGDYRTGVKFVEIVQDDLVKLKKFLKNLAQI